MQAPAHRQDARDERGFTLVEMVVAISLIALSFLALAGLMSSALGALGAARQRSAFIEIANGEMERLRSHPYDSVGVNDTDPNLASAYEPGPSFGGYDAVLITDGSAPAAVTVVTSSEVQGIPLPYTVRRWVTWWDQGGGTDHVFKRLNVAVEWMENGKNLRSIELTSVLYPGGRGPVTEVNGSPVAVMTVCGAVDPLACPPGTIVAGETGLVFDASGSSDPDAGDTLSYRWLFGDGASALGIQTTYTYGAAGTFTAQLTADDGRGGVSVAQMQISVAPQGGNAPPVAGDFTLSPSTGVAPLNVTVFDNGGSSDPDGATGTAADLEWMWDWGDGTANSTGPTAAHEYSASGTFTIRMTVKDSGGLTNSTTKEVVVTPLNCDIESGFFQNPPNNSTTNRIRVTGTNNKPRDLQFKFTAVTNTACKTSEGGGGITGRLPYINGVGMSDTFVVELTVKSEAAGKVTWEGTGSVLGGDSFSLGESQTGEFWSPAYTAADDRFAFAFSVVKG